MTRLAAIDVGTNSVLLSVVEDADGSLTPVHERATVTRLGQGVDRTGRLHPEARERTWACLHDYRTDVERLGASALAVVGTSALRDVADGDVFLARAEALLGVPVQVISGAREAELTFGGALSGLPAQPDEPLFVFDIGGGSTELVWGSLTRDEAGPPRPRVERSVSLQLGSVRLHERFRLGDPPDLRVLDELAAHVVDVLCAFDASPSAPRRVIGVAGTVTTLAALHLGLTHYDGARVHGALLTSDDVRAQAELLARSTLAERLGRGGLDAGRADVIVSGARLCAELLGWLGAETLQASDRGVRYGLLEEMARARRGG